jgi:predicted RND superfamily exporter protein
MSEAKSHGSLSKRWEEAVDNTFFKIGHAVSSKTGAIIAILLTFVFTGVIGFFGGLAKESENRPERLWVPAGSVSLDQNDYIGHKWNSTMRFSLHILGCKGKCNILDTEHITALHELYERVEDLRFDGDWLADQLVKYWVDGIVTDLPMGMGQSNTANGFTTKEDFDKYRGMWSFSLNPLNHTEHNETSPICYKFGPFCAKSSIMPLFNDGEEAVMERLTDKGIRAAVNNWNEMKVQCPVSVARTDSPCIDPTRWVTDSGDLALYGWSQKSDCHEYDEISYWTTLPADRSAAMERCKIALTNYCNAVCQASTMQTSDAGYETQRMLCEDPSCISTGEMMASFSRPAQSSGGEDGDMQKEAVGEFCGLPEPFNVANTLGEKKMKNDRIIGAKYLLGSHAIDERPTDIDGPANTGTDPLANWFEQELLCVFGVTAIPDGTIGYKPYERNDTHVSPLHKTCDRKFLPKDHPIHKFTFSGFTGRSFGDLFGSAIFGDLPFLIGSQVAMIFYLFLTLGSFDKVHSALGLAFAVVVCVQLAINVGQNVGYMAGMKDQVLNSTIAFLLLGLGVDDAFVLTAQFAHATKTKPEASIQERCAMACMHGGVSIFITSLTDALALLIGSATVLPALSWFCGAAGFCVAFCFLFQLTFIVPCIALNAMRAESGRKDCCCCIKGEPRSMFEPRGCCCGFVKIPPNSLERVLRDGFGKRVATTKHGKIGTILFFAASTLIAISGMAQLYSDFRLEWFIPDGNYVSEFLDKNSDIFSSGTSANVYFKDFDFHEKQKEMAEVSAWLPKDGDIDQNEGIEDWHGDFMEWLAGKPDDEDDPRYGVALTNGEVTDKTGEKGYYGLLFRFLISCDGSRHKNAVIWQDRTDCAEYELFTDGSTKCDYDAGLQGARTSFTIAKDKTVTGADRYDTMQGLRKDLAEIFPVEEAFVFSRDFLYWEEVGVIRGELSRNLLICILVVCVIVCIMIPRPKIAAMTLFCIINSIVNVLGFAYYWGEGEKRPHTTINGTSTIYILIACGLAVDYSAHIAHYFNTAKGTAEERVMETLGVIGPSVFHGFFTLMIATVPLSQSVTYVFRTFFKMFFLVGLHGGCQGLFLLPVLLATFGGDNLETEEQKPNTPKELEVGIGLDAGPKVEIDDDDRADV